MASNNFSIVDMEKDDDELQFQDFGLSRSSNSSTRAPNTQTHYFNDFPDSPGHQTDSQKKTCSPLQKRCRYDKHSSDEKMEFGPLAHSRSCDTLMTNSEPLCKDQNPVKETVPVDHSFNSEVKNCSSKIGLCLEQLHTENVHEHPTHVEPAVEKSEQLRLCSKHINIEAILPDNVKSAAELVPALVLRVCNKKQVSKAVKNLSSCWPVAELHHLKRVNRIPGQLSTILHIETSVHQINSHDEKIEKLKSSNSVDGVPNQDAKTPDAVRKANFDEKKTNSAERGISLKNDSSCAGVLAKTKETKNVAADDAFFLYIDLMSSIGIEDWKSDCMLKGVDGNDASESKAKLGLEELDSRLPEPIFSKDICRAIHQKLSEKGIDFSLFSSVFYVGKVSRYAPRLRRQFETATASWPCTFHEDDNLTKLIEGNVFSDGDIKAVVANMNRALALAKKQLNESPKSLMDKLNEKTHVDEVSLHKDSLRSESGKDLDASTSFTFGTTGWFTGNNKFDSERSSCIMVDSMSNRIVAQSVDRRDKHPLAHAAMMAVDRVAQALGGGAWPSLHNDDRENLDSQRRSDFDGEPRHSDVCEPLSSTSSSTSNFSSLSNELLEKTGKETISSSYICTGLDVYLSHEPCIMCAMALLHSRVSRIFYRYKNEAKGALGSVVKVHTLPNINHRYEVFSVAPAECRCLLADRNFSEL